MVETIFIARHGWRWDWDTSDWKSETGLPRDPPLSSFGVSQAQELADHFLAMPVEARPTAIFASPFYRCLQTSKSVALALGVPIYVEHGLSEWYRTVAPGTGLHPRPGSATSLLTYFPEIDPSWTSVWLPSRKGENLNEVLERTAGFLRAFVPTLEHRLPNKHQKILFVSHAAVAVTLVKALLADREFPLFVGCCTITELTRKGGDERLLGGWEVTRLADGSFLKDGSLRARGFEKWRGVDGKPFLKAGVSGTENEVDDNYGSQVGYLAHHRTQ